MSTSKPQRRRSRAVETATDPFGTALRDHHRGRRKGPLLVRDGPETREHPVEEFYFEEFSPDSPLGQWLESWVTGPLLDVGAGVGRHARYFQTQFETVALESSQPLVETMHERGVADARTGDMFALPDLFETGRFESVLAYGTQVSLAGSLAGLAQFLRDLAAVTTADATAVFDSYDPELDAAEELLGYRSDPTPGLASRVLHFEYEGDVGETLLFRLFGPDRIREATVGTDWFVADVIRPAETHPAHYVVSLEKSASR